ncbi:hypothetical protein INT47_003362 [Mucor saturninus]|uniref:Uncharacterized protein n=1 Tax=Mucor saturninus TaxID=64648 RepID=A0A8H7RF98_9FUNG|nr:hypothetical protein INT47_003362 [Mucor saturninus]
MSSFKSLPSNFKQKQNGSTITISFVRDKSIVETSDIILNSPSSLSSSVKKSSPLSKPSWNDEVNDSSMISQKSWLTRRWSTVSASQMVINRRRYKKSTASQLWLNRQKRRTYPPCIVRQQDQKTLTVFKRKHHRQSLADILTVFYHSGSSDSTNSSSVSKRIGKMLKKKKGKQPYNNNRNNNNNNNNKRLRIDTKSDAIKRVFPPATMSSNSSSPSTQIKFPTPPKRFSAIFIDAYGQQGKIDYVRPIKSRPQYLLNLIQHGVDHKMPPITDTYGANQGNPRLSMYATLFLFGFLFFPCWWIGAWLHYHRPKETCCDSHFHLFSVRTFAYLNVLFAAISISFFIVILSLLIWLAKTR